MRSKTLAYIIETFEKANPGIKLKTTAVQWDQTRASSAAPTRRARADVATLDSRASRRPAGGEPDALDKDLSAWPEADRKDIITLSVAKKDGKVYALPWELRVLGMAYNAKVLRERNMPVPGTLDELATEASA